jgi:hypothetical protein
MHAIHDANHCSTKHVIAHTPARSMLRFSAASRIGAPSIRQQVDSIISPSNRPLHPAAETGEQATELSP